MIQREKIYRPEGRLMQNNRCKNKRRGRYFAAFGAGLLVACWCPSPLVVAIVAIVLIFLGFAMC